ncbi:MAG: regulatory iron-sulfur-containing complex subunit RicT [Clostridia bacterium]|nr:regulatory iron-sulfur-containing complex subunit RicT [Clostridia bacterium]
MQFKEVGIKFNNQPKIYSFDPNNINLNIQDYVVVETVRGLEFGQVVTNIKNLSKEPKEPLKKVLRLASEKDVMTAEENKKKVKNYLARTKEIVKSLSLEMKLVNAELLLDRSKIIISFVSEKRIDFRELVKLLAQEFKMKIELRQIGSRDEVKILGGMGICGRTCCCCKNTGDFAHVCIKMAKNQGLSLNPTSISGLCGRLLCCLAYENSQYAEILKQMPKINSEVKTPEGVGRVIYNNLLKKTVNVMVNDNYREFPLEDLKFNKNNQLNDVSGNTNE